LRIEPDIREKNRFSCKKKIALKPFGPSFEVENGMILVNPDILILYKWIQIIPITK